MVTVLFADIVDSTELAEKLDPEHLHSVLGLFFDAMRDEIRAEGGVVEKFIGDAILAAFGVPAAHEDDPARALSAALHMRQRLIDVNKELMERLGVTIRLRMGVNTGGVLAAVNPIPGEPMITGDVVNAAARLQHAAEPDQILVSEKTARMVRSFDFAEVGELELKGRSNPLRAFVLNSGPNTVQREGPRLEASMVGRKPELAILRSVYGRVTAEQLPSTVTIFGEAGIGKSRLTEEFIDRISDLEMRPVIVRGHCLPHGDGSVYWPLAEILKSLAGIRDDDSMTRALERLSSMGREMVTQDVTTDPQATLGALAYTVGIDMPDSPFAQLDPREVRRLIHEAWRSFLSALASISPVIVVIEDLHWADPALLDLLEDVSGRVTGPILFVMPTRPELVERRPTWGSGSKNATAIYLNPLLTDEAQTLVSTLFSGTPIPSSVYTKILDRAEGNPFFIEEIIQHFIDDGAVVRSGSGWSATSHLTELDLPYNVQAALVSRIDLLEPAEKRAIQTAAVVGRVFWPEPVRRLLNLGVDEISEILKSLDRRGLIVARLASSLAREPEFAFRHVLTREVAYESLPRADRAFAHADVASWMEEVVGDRAPEFIELLAYHYLEAHRAAAEDVLVDDHFTEDMRERAYRTSLRAAELARIRHAVQMAYKMGRQASVLAQDPLRRARALDQVGRTALDDAAGDIAWSSLSEAADILLESAGSRPREIALACGMAVESPTRWPGSMMERVPEQAVGSYIEAGLAQLEPGEESEEMVRLLSAKAFAGWAAVAQRVVDPSERAEARRAGTRALEIARRIGRPDLISAALDAAGSLDITEGMYARVIPAVLERIEVNEAASNPFEAGDGYAMAAWSFAYVGDYRRASECAEEGMALGVPEGRGFQIHCASWRAYCAFWAGDWTKITDELGPYVSHRLGVDANEPPNFLSHVIGAEALVESISGGAGEATAILKRMAERQGPALSPTVSTWWAWIMARQGRVDEALSVLDGLRSNRGSRPFRDIVISSVMLENRRFSGVAEFLADARDYATVAGIRAVLPHLNRLEAIASLTDNPSAGGLEILGLARSEFASLGASWEVDRTDRLTEEFAEGIVVDSSHT
jgi:class 3 adenylate cyclase